MNDHELLKLAAEAAGYWVECREDDEIHIKTYKYGDYNRWNPLADDGEALRLAASLGLVLQSNSRGPWAYTEHGSKFPASASAPECDEAGHMHQLRRCIVRAAAQIGGAMK